MTLRNFAIFLLLLCSCVFAQRLPQGIAAPDHYQLAFAPNFETEKFTGDEFIDVRVLKPTSIITLNAAEIAFTKAEITQNGATQTATVKPDEKLQQATLTLGKPLAPGAARIHITYSGILNKQLRGLYLSQTKARKYAVTQFEATDARRAFPSFDEPAYKATFDVTAVINSGDMAISNSKVATDTPGVLAEVATALALPSTEGKHTVVFATSPKMSSYLVALAVGDFACVSGEAENIPIRICSTPENKDRLAFTLEAAEHIMQFYNRYYAIKYPYAKLDVLGTPDFSAGAMENTAAIFARDVLVSLDPASASEGQRHEVAVTLAHEMAHQWFGDLVTMQWWDDIWLNEGFATWMETRPLIDWQPQWHDAMDEVVNTEESMNVDSQAATRPIHLHAETPDEINELFDGIAYGKAAAVVRMIEAYLGPEVFRNGVNRYLEKFKWSNATAADFWNTMTEATGKPVNQIMPGFVNQPGVPVVSMSAYECAGANCKLTLHQKRYFSDAKQFQKASKEVWNIPVCWRQAAASAPQCEVLTQREQSFRFRDAGGPLFGNAGATGYYRFEYPPKTALSLAESGKLTPGEQIDLLNDEWAMVDVNRATVGDFLQIVTQLRSSRNPSVLQAIARRLQDIDDDLTDSSDLGEFEQWVRNFAEPLYRETGFEPKEGEKVELAQLRGVAIHELAEIAKSPEVIAAAHELASKYARDPRSVSPSIAGTAVQAATLSNDPELYDQFLAALKAAKDPNTYYRFFNALPRFSSPELVRRTMQFAISPDVRDQDTATMLAIALGDPRTRDTAWDFIRQNWAAVSKHLPPFEGETVLVSSTSSFCDAQHLAQVKQFFTEHPAQGAERTLQQSLEAVNQCIALRAAQQPKLAEWLKQNSSAGK